mmetsp:Transcript_88815/g.248590  ORF Transcript_88815/g.248590 Transcript_88815/m.248590 type:complete len:279 (+) Transcript_88815:2520-3356(+)
MRYEGRRLRQGSEGEARRGDRAGAGRRRSGDGAPGCRAPAEEVAQHRRGSQGLHPRLLPHPAAEQAGEGLGRPHGNQAGRPHDVDGWRGRRAQVLLRRRVHAGHAGRDLRGLQGPRPVRRRRLQRHPVRVWPDRRGQDLHHGGRSWHVGCLPQNYHGVVQSDRAGQGAIQLHGDGIHVGALPPGPRRPVVEGEPGRRQGEAERAAREVGLRDGRALDVRAVRHRRAVGVSVGPRHEEPCCRRHSHEQRELSVTPRVNDPDHQREQGDQGSAQGEDLDR